MPGRDKTTTSPADKAAHYHGHRQRLRQRFLAAGSEAISDYEMLELILFRAIPQRDVKPLAKELLASFGSFSEVIAAPAERARPPHRRQGRPRESQGAEADVTRVAETARRVRRA